MLELGAQGLAQGPTEETEKLAHQELLGTLPYRIDMSQELKILWKNRWPNFSPEEVLSPMGLQMFDKNILLIQPHAMDKLQEFRIKLNTNLLINHAHLKLRGYRHPSENAKAGGEEFSFHMLGLAFDLTAPSLSTFELKELAKDFGWHGVGYYPSKNFVHVDLRPRLNPNRTWYFERP